MQLFDILTGRFKETLQYATQQLLFPAHMGSIGGGPI